MPTKPQVIWFDAGNTLLRTAKPVGHIYAEIASHYGAQLNGEKLHQGFIAAWKARKPLADTTSTHTNTGILWWKQIVRDTLTFSPPHPSFPFDDYFHELYDLFSRPGLWRLYPEVETCLERLQSLHIPCGILSNWDPRLRTILQGFEISHYFQDILISEELGIEKPNPAIFQTALNRIPSLPEATLLIGDDPICDGAAQQYAGWQVEIVDRPRKNIADILDSVIRM